MMSDIDLESLMNAPIYAFESQVMIGDIQDYLEFSEGAIEWQYRTERQSIKRRAEGGHFQSFPSEYRESYREHLETCADHRFKVSLPLRIRYGALLALVTAVEWSVACLAQRATTAIPEKPKGKSKTAYALEVLTKRARLQREDAIADFEALSCVRNCIAHSAGLEEDYTYREQLDDAIGRLKGFSLAKWHFLGSHVAIEKGALDTYIDGMRDLVVDLYKKADDQGLLTSDT